ncbi:MAG: DUF2029 domain-containing protein [Anaerolineales bacterium]|nr:MAG: DUF2029 domain-containing protein [Anaerolineales bacterium]
MRQSNPGWIRWLVAVILAFLLIILVWSNFRFALQSPGGNDFLARWTGAHYWLVEGLNPYDEQVSLEAQKMIYGRPADPSKGEDIAHFVYPLPAMLFFAPFGLLPYTLARALWMTILQIALPVLAMISIRISRWKPSPVTFGFIIFLSIFWYHGVRAVIVGQFAVIEALLIAGGLWAIQREADSISGVLLGLTIAKPQMAFLIVPYVLIWALRVRRPQIVLWCLATVIGLTTASVLILPGWPLMWLRQLASYPTYTDIGSPLSILISGVPDRMSWVKWILPGVLAAYLSLEWIRSMGKDDAGFQWTAALTLVVTNLIAFRTATTNYVVLFPALVLIFHSWSQRWGKQGITAIWVGCL